MHRRKMVGPQEKTATYKLRREASEKPILLTPWSLSVSNREHWGAHVSFRSGFLGVYAQKWDCWVIWQFYFQFFKKSPHCFP